VQLEWRAFELHPGIPPEGTKIPWDPATMAARRGNFARLAAQDGLEVGTREHWYDSTPAHEASEWATERGAGDAFRRGVYRAYFVHDRNIGSPEVLAGIAAEAGLDGAALQEDLHEGTYRDRIAAQYAEARSLGVTAVPTFVAGRYAIVGAQPYEAFCHLMEVLGQPPREPPDRP
jgi:predicted DsbA family dithiol-disulfide isomerase